MKIGQEGFVLEFDEYRIFSVPPRIAFSSNVNGPLGCYEIEKDGEKMTVVAVLMKVTKVDEQWKECDWRERQWLSASKALKMLSEDELRQLLEIAVKSIQQG